jgi:CMP-N-acetylneuraminic acid synthetase
MYYAIRNIRNVLGKCYVSTDSEEYARYAEDCGAIVLERPEGLGTDETRIIEVLSYHGKGYDGVLCQPPTAPFVSEETLLRLLSGIHRGSSAITVTKSRENGRIWGEKTVYPRQKRQEKFFLNGCASFRGAEVLLECDLTTNALFEPSLVEIPYPEALNIDDAWDWTVAEWIAGNTMYWESTTTSGRESSTGTLDTYERIYGKPGISSKRVYLTEEPY